MISKSFKVSFESLILKDNSNTKQVWIEASIGNHRFLKTKAHKINTLSNKIKFYGQCCIIPLQSEYLQIVVGNTSQRWNDRINLRELKKQEKIKQMVLETINFVLSYRFCFVLQMENEFEEVAENSYNIDDIESPIQIQVKKKKKKLKRTASEIKDYNFEKFEKFEKEYSVKLQTILQQIEQTARISELKKQLFGQRTKINEEIFQGNKIIKIDKVTTNSDFSIMKKNYINKTFFFGSSKCKKTKIIQFLWAAIFGMLFWIIVTPKI